MISKNNVHYDYKWPDLECHQPSVQILRLAWTNNHADTQSTIRIIQLTTKETFVVHICGMLHNKMSMHLALKRGMHGRTLTCGNVKRGSIRINCLWVNQILVYPLLFGTKITRSDGRRHVVTICNYF